MSQRWKATIRTPGGIETVREVAAPDRGGAIAIATMHGDQLLFIEQDRSLPPITPPPPAPDAALPPALNSAIWIDPRCIKAGVLAALWQWSLVWFAISVVLGLIVLAARKG
jgi:hypothetical protein